MTAADESQLYRDLMRFKPDDMTPNAWAVSAGVSRTVWSDMRRHGNPSRRTLERLLAVAGSSLAEFEALRIGTPSLPGARPGDPPLADVRGRWGPARLPPMPLLATAAAGDWEGPAKAIEMTELDPGRAIDMLPRPASLAGDPDAFALTIVGDSMWPRFRPGRRIAVSPRSALVIGDDVVVHLARSGGDSEADSGRRVLIKEFVRRTGESIELRQFHPPATFRVNLDAVERMDKVLGELI